MSGRARWDTVVGKERDEDVGNPSIRHVDQRLLLEETIRCNAIQWWARTRTIKIWVSDELGWI